MTFLEIIKLIWRQILATRELKETFFHGKSELIENKILTDYFVLDISLGLRFCISLPRIKKYT
jgi:hypothetical protein